MDSHTGDTAGGGSEEPEAYYLPRGNRRYEPTRATESPSGPYGSARRTTGCPSCPCDRPDCRGAASDRPHLGRHAGPHPAPRGRCRGLRDQARPTGTPDRGPHDCRRAGCCHGESVAHRYGDRPPITGDEETVPPTVPPRPATQPFYPGLDDWGYGRSIEWRFTRGGFDTLGAADVWARVHLPLVDGVALTGQDRALILADSANGLSLSLPLEQWFSIPPTTTATLLRPPAGEWVHLACRTYLAERRRRLRPRRPVRPGRADRRGRPATAYAEAQASQRRLLTA